MNIFSSRNAVYNKNNPEQWMNDQSDGHQSEHALNIGNDEVAWFWWMVLSSHGDRQSRAQANQIMIRNVRSDVLEYKMSCTVHVHNIDDIDELRLSRAEIESRLELAS